MALAGPQAVTLGKLEEMLYHQWKEDDNLLDKKGLFPLANADSVVAA